MPRCEKLLLLSKINILYVAQLFGLSFGNKEVLTSMLSLLYLDPPLALESAVQDNVTTIALSQVSQP